MDFYITLINNYVTASLTKTKLSVPNIETTNIAANKMQLGAINDVEEAINNLDTNSVKSVNNKTGDIKILDARGLDTYTNDLWSTVVTTDEDGNIILENKELDAGEWNKNVPDSFKSKIHAFKNNKIYDLDGNVIANIELDKIKYVSNSAYKEGLLVKCGNVADTIEVDEGIFLNAVDTSGLFNWNHNDTRSNRI